MNDIIWKLIYKKLTEKGFEVYSPGQHTGDCLTKYVVVKTDGAAQFWQYSSNRCSYDIMCYVPRDHYSELAGFFVAVKEAMAELYPTLRPAHNETSDYYDEGIKGHMVSAQYYNYKKLTRRT